jgi:hypothetical protein
MISVSAMSSPTARSIRAVGRRLPLFTWLIRLRLTPARSAICCCRTPARLSSARDSLTLRAVIVYVLLQEIGDHEIADPI